MHHLFSAWPTNFVELFSAAGITRGHMPIRIPRPSGDSALPFFLWRAIMFGIRSCAYKPADEEIDAGLDALNRRGIPFIGKKLQAVTGWPKYQVAAGLRRFAARHRDKGTTVKEAEPRSECPAGPWRLSNEELQLIEPLLSNRIRLRKLRVRDLLEAILFASINRLPWHALPAGFPSASNTQKFFCRISESGLLHSIVTILNSHRSMTGQVQITVKQRLPRPQARKRRMGLTCGS